MKKFIITLLLSLIALPVYSASNLWEYYNYDLPSIEDRAIVADLMCGIPDYIGTFEQNIKFLACLEFQDKEVGLGASLDIPTSIALFKTSLASGITANATTMTLVSSTDKDGNTLASSTYAFIIDEGTSIEEFVIADCTGTACTNMERGISVLTGTTSVTSLKKVHRRGASVKITNAPQLLILSRIINGQGRFPNSIGVDGSLDIDGNITMDSGDITGVSTPLSTEDNYAATVEYVNSVAQQGAATSTETSAGISEDTCKPILFASSKVIG